MKTYVIAEAGSTWWPHRENIDRLIAIAQEAGASAFKLQWTSDGEKLAARRHAPELAAMYTRYLQWPKSWHAEIKTACEAARLDYLCTVCLSEDIAVIVPYVSRFKISSFDASDEIFYRACRRFQKPLIISTGMMEAQEARNMLEYLEEDDAALLCTSAYPCPIDQVNLNILRNWDWAKGDGRFLIGLGLSDHTAHLLTGAFAVCCGAEIIEVHVRLDDTPPENPDYGHSLSPEQLKEYILNIRIAEMMLGDGIKKVMPCEQNMLKYRVKN